MILHFLSTYVLDHISTHNIEITIKLFVSLFLGLIIGLERELTNKTAGLRTHILVCLGSTVFTILSIYGFSHFNLGDGMRIDPERIAAQILTGIGFIGGGAVLHYGVNVFGLTTAATLWITASIGMSVGTGSYFVAILATIITFIVLVVIRKFENVFLSRGISKGGRIKVAVSCAREEQSDIHKWFYNEFKNIQELSASKIQDEKDTVKLTFVMDIKEEDPVNNIYKKVAELKNIESLSIKQIMV